MNFCSEKVDIKENTIINFDYNLLSILLKDHSSKKNIIWATDNYCEKGIEYTFSKEITIDKITGKFGQTIKPRIKKSKHEQDRRVKDKAEVFTPSWICNMQNNLIDSAWFSRDNVFNIEQGTSWITKKEKIDFSTLEEKSWEDYVKSNRLEISCGEAPYIVSRYDTTTGDVLDVIDRIGFLDRKIRIICENVENEEDWYKWVVIAYKSVYGYEWQGDSLLIARENLLYSFIDYYNYKFNCNPTNEQLMEIAEIISWNLWQMDGLKGVIPNSCHKEDLFMQLQLFGMGDVEEKECYGCKKNNIYKHNGIYCKIMNWKTNRTVKYVLLAKKGRCKYD